MHTYHLHNTVKQLCPTSLTYTLSIALGLVCFALAGVGFILCALGLGDCNILYTLSSLHKTAPATELSRA